MGAKLLQPTLTAGEMAPSLHGRVDINRYMAGLRKCRNFIVRPYGGVENRNGLRYCYGREDATDHRLIPFVYSTEVSYVLYVGDGFIRFQTGGADVAPNAPAYAGGTTYGLDDYVTSAGIVYRSLQAANTGHTPATSPLWWVADSGLQISAPWTAAQVGDLRFTQSADVLYLVHGDVQQRELRRTSANTFELRLFQPKEGPFLDLNADESIKVAASAVLGEVTLTASAEIFTANAIGALFYLEPKNLGQLKPWVVGDRNITVGTLRRSDGKTYKAVTVPAGGTWHETGPRQPIHENGRFWDGGGETKTNGVDTWSVGIEWEFVDTGYGVVLITGVTDGQTATGTVTKRLPASVVGGVGSPANTWTLDGDGATKTFAIAGAGYGVYSVTIDGTGIQPDPNYEPPGSVGGGILGCVHVDSLLLDGSGGEIRAGDVLVGDTLELYNPETNTAALGTVTLSKTVPAALWRVTTADEVMLVCSSSAPIPVRREGGRVHFVFPPSLYGQEIPVNIGGLIRWSVVCDLQRLGAGEVQMITVGDRCFWAREEQSRGHVLHHNAKNNDTGVTP